MDPNSNSSRMAKKEFNHKISSLPRKKNHEAALTIANAFEDDPLFKKAFRNVRARFVMTYAIAASQLGSGNVSADSILIDATVAELNDNGGEEGEKNDLNPVQSVCLWEATKDDLKFGFFELVLRNMCMSFSMYYYFIKGAAYSVGYRKQVGVLINAILVILYGVCTLWVIRFLLELVGFVIVYMYMVIEGYGCVKKYEKDHGEPLGRRPKHLSMVGTLAASRGQGIGSELMKYSLAKLDESNLYDYYYLESSNPKNVPFYERHGFVVVGDVSIMGDKATFMIRKKPTSIVSV